MGVRLLEESCPVGFGPRIPDDDGLNACGVRGTQAGKRVLEDERLIGAHAEGLEREVVDLGVWLDAAHVLARENGVEDAAECKLGRDVRVDGLLTSSQRLKTWDSLNSLSDSEEKDGSR